MLQRPYIMLPLILLLAAPPLLLDLGVRDVGRVMENVALLSSQETWLRQHRAETMEGDDASTAFLRPSSKGTYRIMKPPMVVWLNMLAWWDLTPENSTPQQLLWRARLVTVFMGLLLAGAVYWLGWTLADPVAAAAASLSLATTWYFQRQCRTASYDIHLAAWATLAVAAAVASMRPLPAAAGKRTLLWLLFVLATSMAWLSKGPLALALVILPMLAAIWKLARDRRGEFLRFALAMIAVAAICLPWYRYIRAYAPEVSYSWYEEFLFAIRNQKTQVFYYMSIFGMLAPWSVWLIAGLLMPWMKGLRLPARSVGWAFCWFAAIILLFTLPPTKQQRYILPAIAPAHLLIGMAFAQWRMTIVEDPHRRFFWPHVIGLLLGSLSAVFLTIHPIFSQLGWYESIAVNWLATGPTIALIVALLALAAVTMQMARKGRVLSVAIGTAIWMATLTTTFWPLADAAPQAHHLFIAAAEKSAPVIRSRPAYRLGAEDADYHAFKNLEEYYFYARRLFPPLTPDQIPQRLRAQPELVIYGRAVDSNDRILKAAGLWILLDDLQIFPDKTYRIWGRPR